MFDSKIYTERRNRLKKLVANGLVLLPGNTESAMNYPANTYHFRQDSTFLYYFGLDHPDLAGVIDLDSGKDFVFGNDVDMDDIIWMGPQPSMNERAAHVGVENTKPLSDLEGFIKQALASGRKIHFLPAYRGETTAWLSELLGIKTCFLKSYVSAELIRAVVAMREIKESCEIAEIDAMVDVAYEMHTTAMRMAKPGIIEKQISGRIEGIALEKAAGVSFPVILTINGQTLHNHYHGNILKEGRMMISDAGAESDLRYCSDITRSTPVGGKFSQRQKEVYEVCLAANVEAIKAIKPGVLYRDIHLLSAEVIATGLKNLGLMKGDVREAVRNGAHALFFPHGLGHQMGLDVHDLEGLGENNVGYDNEVSRSDQFGLAFLRMGKRLKSGLVLTVEPGIYFIPALIDQWKSENKFTEFIDYNRVEQYRDFGGIRIEDDVLVTDSAYRVMGKPIPKTVAEVEAIAAE
jgi:Xaa-Pro aminopeptidase